MGKRTAEHIVLDLKNKLPEQLMAGSGKVRPQSVMGEAGGDAVQALLSLGYREARVKAVVAELALASPEESAEGLIRQALAKLR